VFEDIIPIHPLHPDLQVPVSSQEELELWNEKRWYEALRKEEQYYENIHEYLLRDELNNNNMNVIIDHVS
jgi:DNA-binding transcriptional regulator/RsmH inhibitor MraZ